MSFRFALLARYGFALCLWFLCAALARADAGRLKIVATNYPLAYFAERLVGDRAAVEFPVPAADTDPAYWEPKAKGVAALQKADLILLNGADYEKWLSRVSLSKLKQVNTSAAFKDRYIHTEGVVVHSHGPGGTHAHAGTVYTTWLDFEQAALQAQAVAEAIAKKRPEWKSLVMENLAGLKADLLALDADLRSAAAAQPNKSWLAFHPMYDYLGRRYGFDIASVHWDTDEMPPPQEWEALKRTLAGHPAKWMLWEAAPLAEVAAQLKAMGVASVVFDLCGNRPREGDFLTVMRANVENLKAALR